MSDLPQLGEALRDRYRVERELGAGGMATVYLAHDLKHDRDVAIKVLHPDLAAALGAERFLSEIKTTAKLQHPHILALIDSGEADGLLFYVMPFVQGETLRARLARERQLPVDEAVRLAREIASALDYAHRQGVIHRDVKPENILLHDGSALVADFGISLAVSAAGGPRMTQTGLSLGTPQYMSPEQAMGERIIDARADIYALGAVTYEMLAGEAPFTGPSVQAIVARVITEQPRALVVQRKSVPPAVEAAVMRALEKLPADRFGTAKEFGDALVSSAPVTTAVAAAPRAPARVRAPQVATFAAVALVAAGIGWAAHRAPVVHGAPVRFTVTVGLNAYRSAGAERTIALSPDGSALAYVAFSNLRQRIFLREMTDLEAHALPGGEGAYEVAFSPDGEWIAFVTDAGIMKIPARGGTPTLLVSLADASSLSWPSRDLILFSRDSKRNIFGVPASGGASAPVPGAEKIDAAGELAGWPIGLPDGETIVYASVGADRSFGSARMALLSMATRRRTVLELPGMVAFGVVGEHLIYALTDGTLMAAPVDLKGQRLLGPAVPLSMNVFARSAPAAALSASGTFAYIGGAPDRVLTLRDRTGRLTPLSSEARPFSHPRLSPDGRKVAVEISASDSSDIWILDRTSSTLSRLTTGGSNQRPEWSVDGRSVYYLALGGGADRASRLFGIKRATADGSAPPESVYFSNQTIREVAPTPDGRSVVFRVDAATTQRDIWQLPLAAGAPAKPVLATSFDERTPRVSPDGRWIVYSSDEGGGNGHDVFVRAFPGPGPRVQISQGGGVEPLWSADGRRIYYRDGERMRVATLSMAPTLSVTGRDSLFTDAYVSDGLHPDYDVGRDGSFVLIDPAGTTGVVVIVNWATEFLQRMGGKP